jgi:arylsulfatase B
MKNILTGALLLFFITAAKAQRNVILIIADDLGSDWCGFQENRVDTVNMPNVRKLLSRGVRFSNAWSNPVCSPTRAGVLTGRYSFRTGVGNVASATIQLDTAETTLPKLLKNPNAPTRYTTANIGKWHLHTPTTANYNNPYKMGYDYFAGSFSGQLVDYRNWTKITNNIASNSTIYATSETTNDAITWLGTQNTQPFFLWLAYNAPHSPFHLPPDTLHSYRNLSGTAQDINQNPKAYFKAMAEALDNQIGKLFTWLQANNKWENTDIIFIGDNGNTMNTAQTAPFNRAKSTVYQQGIHVPFIVSGPSVVSPGRTSSALVNVQDLFASILELANYTNWRTQIPANKPVDSKSLVPILKNTATEARPWAYSEIFNIPATASVSVRTMRNTTYKLIHFDSSRVQEFYNLATDPTERTNILAQTLSAAERTNYDYLCAEMELLLGRTICNTRVNTQNIRAHERPIIAPNPAQNLISISLSDTAAFSFQITTLEGKQVKEGNTFKDIDVSALSNGFYLLKIQSSSNSFIEKIVIEK